MSVTIGKTYDSIGQYQKDNYYLKDAEPRLFGKGWEYLNADKEKFNLNEEAYQRLSNGLDPVSGERLSDSFRKNHRSGYNITFSPDKSFSVLLNSITDEQTKQKLIDAHHQAVHAALEYLEQNLAQARTGAQGEHIERTGNITAFMIDHSVNRNGDVQFHTHVVLFNMTYNEQSGKWQALHSDAFKSNMLEKIYENELVKNLRELGYATEMKKSESGRSEYAAIRGIDEKVIRATSTRAAEIKEAVERLEKDYQNASKGELKQIAAYETRNEKQSWKEEQIQKRFESQLESAGYTKEQIVASVQTAAALEKEAGIERKSADEIVRTAREVLSEQKSVFTQNDLVKTALELSRGDVSLKEIQNAVQQDKEFIVIADMKVEQSKRTTLETIYTTKENYRSETNSLKMIQEGIGKRESILDNAKEMIESYERKKNIQLTDSQKAALEAALSSRDMVGIFQGYAGVGKTTVLSALKEIAEAQGYRIVGLSETNAAVREMRTVGIDSMTVTKFMNELEKENEKEKNKNPINLINDKTIIVIDEASFLSAKHAEKILSLAVDKGARVHLWGDKSQLPAIQAGFIFRDAQEKTTTTKVELVDIVRQKDENLREAVKNIVDKKIDEAFEKLDVREKSTDELVQSAAKEYMKSFDADKKVMVVTFTNELKSQINNAIREELKERNVISRDEQTVLVYTQKGLSGTGTNDVRNYAIGDKLVLNKKSEIFGKAGTEYHVKNIDYDRGKILAHAIEKEKDGQMVMKEKEIDIRTQGHLFTAYEKRLRNFSENDKIIFTKNIGKEIKNNMEATIKGFDVQKGIMYFQLANEDKIRTLDLRNTDLHHFDHAYAQTAHRSQGQTVDAVIYVSQMKDLNDTTGLKTKPTEGKYNEFYVAISRAKETAIILTDDRQALQEAVRTEIEKETVPEALEKAERAEKEKEKEFTEEKEFAEEKQEVKELTEHTEKEFSEAKDLAEEKDFSEKIEKKIERDLKRDFEEIEKDFTARETSLGR